MKLLTPDDSFEDLTVANEGSFWRTDRHGGLECLSATFSTHLFSPHTHETYVIGTVLSGKNVHNCEEHSLELPSGL